MCHKLIIQKCSVTRDWCSPADNLNVWQLIREFWPLSSEYHVGACHTEGLRGVTWMPFDSQPTQTRLDGTAATLSLPKETDCPLIASKEKLTFIVWHNYSCGALYLLSENSNLTWPESTEDTLETGKARLEGRVTNLASSVRHSRVYLGFLITRAFHWSFCTCCYRANVSRVYLGREVIHRSVNNALILPEHCLDG